MIMCMWPVERCRNNMRRVQGIMARTLLSEGMDDLEVIAGLTALDVDNAKVEKDRLAEAWRMVLEGRSNEDVLKTGIEMQEAIELKAIKRDRRKLLHCAFEFGLTCDLIGNFLGLDEEEMDIWYNDWIGNRRFCCDDE